MNPEPENIDPESIDVDAVMREIRQRARRPPAPLVFPEDGGAPQRPSPSFELSRLRYSAIELREAMRRVNEMPPQPPTLRGKIGGILVRLLKRALFWQTEQQRRFQTAAVNAADEQSRALETLWTDVQGLAAELARLASELAAHRSLAQQERLRLETLLREQSISQEEFAEECRASLLRLEHGMLGQAEKLRFLESPPRP
jgi:hypothetical protein